MNEPRDIEAILDRFRDWLADARAEVETEEGHESAFNSDPEPPPEIGLIDLVEEFTALRHELKLQTKSGRGLIEQTESSVAALRQAIDHFRSVEPKEAQAVWAAARGLAEALADLDEALVRGQHEIDRARRQIADESTRKLEASMTNLFRKRSWIRRQFLRSYYHDVIDAVRRECQAHEEVFEGFLEGYGLIQKRLRRALASEQIAHIPCVGEPVDPELMTVVELVDEPPDQPGTVARELRRGYTWRGRVIRFAEVQAVRGPSILPADQNGKAFDPDEPGEGDIATEIAEELEPTDDSRGGPA